MFFFLGFLSGLAVSVLFVVVMIYFKEKIVMTMTTIEKKIENSGEKKKGVIHFPESDVQMMRKEIIERNQREGRITKLSDL